jgi:hypothetical protein
VTYASTLKESKLLVSVANDAPGAKGRLDQLAKHFKQTGECSAAAELGEGGIRAKNSFEGAARMLAGTNLLSETEAFAISIPLPSIRTAATKRWLEASSGTGHPRQGCHFHQAGNPG